jgi:hypothetical protein
MSAGKTGVMLVWESAELCLQAISRDVDDKLDLF